MKYDTHRRFISAQGPLKDRHLHERRSIVSLGCDANHFLTLGSESIVPWFGTDGLCRGERDL